MHTMQHAAGSPLRGEGGTAGLAPVLTSAGSDGPAGGDEWAGRVRWAVPGSVAAAVASGEAEGTGPVAVPAPVLTPAGSDDPAVGADVADATCGTVSEALWATAAAGLVSACAATKLPAADATSRDSCLAENRSAARPRVSPERRDEYS